MRKIRVLIVDDAVVIRRVVYDVLENDPQIEVADTAANGEIALQKIEQATPDIVVLDIEMPVLDGLGTLTALREKYPKLPVIMFSQLTERGADATLDALFRGANDYVTKPASSTGLPETRRILRESLIPKIMALCANEQFVKYVVTKSATVKSTMPSKVLGNYSAEILAIGASTGGPNALAALLTQLPANFPVPIVIVQHMPPLFTQLLSRRLESISPFMVAEAIPGQKLRPNHVWLAPGDYHMALNRTSHAVELLNHQGPAENSCRPSVDVLFRSVAEVYGRHALAVVLTGMGQDGLRGCEEINRQGGRILVQDKASSVVWGMPGAVAEAGLASKVLPINRLATEIMQRVRYGRTKRAANV